MVYKRGGLFSEVVVRWVSTVHTYIHTYIHTYTHTYTHTYIHIHIHTYTHTYIHTYRWRFCLVTRGPQGPRLMSRATANPIRKKCTLSWWSEDGLPQGEDMERFRLIFFHKKCYRIIPCSYKCAFSSQVNLQQHFTAWEQWCSMSN